MTDPSHASSEMTLAFGPFRVIPAQRRLLHGTRPLKLGKRAREILFALLERAGELVTKRELTARVWPGVIVGEGTLRVHIAALRSILRHGASDVSYIESVTGRGYRFVAPLRELDEAPPSTSQAPAENASSNLPTLLTRVFGREETLTRLIRRLPRRRLLTIVGPGGIGKTTVAMAAAEQLSASYEHGTRFVDLSLIADPALVAATLAAALGLPVVSADPLPACIEELKHRRMLLVLDNCEHVIEAVARVTQKILAETTHVHVLATGREPLRASGEWVLRLRPLEIPPPAAALTAARSLEFSAVELFVERTMASQESWELLDADAGCVAEICRKLDGLPLAI